MNTILLPLGSVVIFSMLASIGYAMRQHHWWMPVACFAPLIGYLLYATQGAGLNGMARVIIGIFAILPAAIGLACGVGFGWYKNAQIQDDPQSSAARGSTK